MTTTLLHAGPRHRCSVPSARPAVARRAPRRPGGPGAAVPRHVFAVRRALVAAVLLAALGGLVQLFDGGAPGGITPVSTSTYVVAPGDTLWSIAGELAPRRDPRGVVDALVRANPELAVDRLVVGDAVAVPDSLLR